MKIRSRWLIRLLSRLIAGACRALFATTRVEVCAARPGISPYEDSGAQKSLYCVWHDAILGPIFGGRCVDMAALVSLHGDGSYVADALECVGITPIRGSSSRGGAAAVREMLDAARDKDISIATDGPRGPRREVKLGIVYLASQTGRPIVPTAFSARRGWRVRGRWTDLLIPKPCTRIWLLGGEPILVPPGLSREDLKAYRDRVQQAMDELSAQADRLASGSGSGSEIVVDVPRTAA
ncbi:MAG: lysophospholipid acyltransferase family protein [Planctomycetaceae bacterium]